MKKRILIIEDDAAQRELFRTTLTSAGYEVLTASDGRAGLQLYAQYPCDVIVTDIFMPKADGIETIFDLKAQHAHVKIIAISGGGSWSQYGNKLAAEEPLEIATHFGADRTLKKPIKLPQLVDTIDELLKLEEQSSGSGVSRSLLSQEVAKKRILVVEDDVAQRRLFKSALESAGYEVLEAADGKEALELHHQKPCDLVITDIFMPQGDGIETIFDLRSQRSGVKIIAISGGGSWSQHGIKLEAEDPLEMAKKFGADRTLKKPVKIQRLLALVDELLNVKGRLYTKE